MLHRIGQEARKILGSKIGIKAISRSLENVWKDVVRHGEIPPEEGRTAGAAANIF